MTATKTDVMHVKQGDTRKVGWDLPGFDLTGCTARIIVKRNGVVTVLVASVATPPTLGRVEHQLTGTLAVGTYLLEIEVTRGSEITTVPSDGYSQLIVVADLD